LQLILVVKAIIFVDAKGGVGVCGPLDVLKRVFLMEICLHEWIGFLTIKSFCLVLFFVFSSWKFILISGN